MSPPEHNPKPQKPPKNPRARLDLSLVERGLASDLHHAQALIMAGRVLLNDTPATKAGQPVRSRDLLRLKNTHGPQASGRFVSRGGDKLDAALSRFARSPDPLSTADRVGLDVGASTGGFTDCLLQRGAQHVYAVDVGYGQLAWSLRQDPRVTLFERAHICALTSAQIPPVNLVVIDVSFTSLLRVLPCVETLMSRPADLIVLIKPQFEATAAEIEPGGVVRDQAIRQHIIDRTLQQILARGFTILDTLDSPIHGPEGNIEHLAWLRWPSNS